MTTTLSPEKAENFYKRLSRYKQNDYLQYSTFKNSGITKQQFYFIMEDLVEKNVLKKVYEIYSPFSKESVSLYEEFYSIPSEFYDEEFDQLFQVDINNIIIKFKVNI